MSGVDRPMAAPVDTGGGEQPKSKKPVAAGTPPPEKPPAGKASASAKPGGGKPAKGKRPAKRTGRRTTKKKIPGAPSAEIIGIIEWLGGKGAKGKRLILFERLAHATMHLRAMTAEISKHADSNTWLRLYAEAQENCDLLTNQIYEIEKKDPDGSTPAAPHQPGTGRTTGVGTGEGGDSPQPQPETATATPTPDDDVDLQ